MKTSRKFFQLSLSLVLLVFLAASDLFAQPQPGFSYQAVARDNNGSPLAEQALTLKISIHAGTPTGDITWQESQDVETNAFGLFSVIVGGPEGYDQAGSASSFAEIDWSAEQYFMNIGVKRDADFIDMGTAPLQMVPVAQYAATAKNATGNFTVKAQSQAGDGEALFEVRRSDGSVAFAVYEDMVWVFVDTSETKGVKGGFAVGGYNSSKGSSTEFLRVTPDSIRMYINTQTQKGSKGGFAVGGYNSAKNTSADLLTMNQDSIRMYILNDPAKGVKGGFAVGGYNSAKSGTYSFITLTPENYFIGQDAGLNTTNGTYNSVLGYEAAKNLTEGSDNVFIGYQSGYNNTLGLENVFIGKNAGYSNVGAIQTDPYYLSYGSLNVFIGTNAGFSNDSGWTNLFVGNAAGYDNKVGSDNTFIGNLAGQHNVNGTANTYIGTFSGRSNTEGDQNVNVGFYAGNKSEGDYNTYLGANAGANNTTGYDNTFIGSYSGYSATGYGNTFIGNGAGSNEMGNNKLYIDNSSTGTPLIKGDFALNNLALNGDVGIDGDPVGGTSLYIHGNAVATLVTEISDQRLKTDIRTIENALDKVLKMRGVSFRWNNEALERQGFDESPRIGLIAQELEEQVPELVREQGDGTMTVSYGDLTAVLVEAIKEQQTALDEKEARILELEERLSRLEERMEESIAK